MALNAGSVTINASGNATGSGLALALHGLLVVGFGVSPAQAPNNVPGAQQQIASLANAIAAAVVAHITANAVVTVAAGIPVTTNGSATTQAGATTATGTGTIS
jgi:hypothetical protein